LIPTSLLSPFLRYNLGGPLSLPIEEVGAELRRLQSGRATCPDGVCPRLLRDCADQLAIPLQRLFNMSFQMENVLMLWKTYCLILSHTQIRATGRAE